MYCVRILTYYTYQSENAGTITRAPKHIQSSDLEGSGKFLRLAARSCEVVDRAALVDLSPLPCLAQSQTE